MTPKKCYTRSIMDALSYTSLFVYKPLGKRPHFLHIWNIIFFLIKHSLSTAPLSELVCVTHFIPVFESTHSNTCTAKMPISAKFRSRVQISTTELWNYSYIYICVFVWVYIYNYMTNSVLEINQAKRK